MCFIIFNFYVNYITSEKLTGYVLLPTVKPWFRFSKNNFTYINLFLPIILRAYKMGTLARNGLKTHLELVLDNTKVIFFKAEFLYIFFLHLAVYVSKKGK